MLPGHRRRSPSGKVCPPPSAPSLDVKVEFVGSVHEGKDHPFMSLWTEGATVESSSDTVPSLLTRKGSPVSPFLQGLFLNYFQDIPGLCRARAPPGLCDQPTPRAEEELPVRTEQI